MGSRRGRHPLRRPPRRKIDFRQPARVSGAGCRTSTCVVGPGETAGFLARCRCGCWSGPSSRGCSCGSGSAPWASWPLCPDPTSWAGSGPRARWLIGWPRVSEGHPLHARRPPPELSVAAELDPPAGRADQAAFVRQGAGRRAAPAPGRAGAGVPEVAVEVETEHGERCERLWRDEGALTAAAVADRVRWQLDGWLNGGSANRPTAGIIRIELVPDEVLPAKGRQLGFWGGETATAERASRSLARVVGLLGPEAVRVPEATAAVHRPSRWRWCPSTPSISPSPASSPLRPAGRALAGGPARPYPGVSGTRAPPGGGGQRPGTPHRRQRPGGWSMPYPPGIGGGRVVGRGGGLGRPLAPRRALVGRPRLGAGPGSRWSPPTAPPSSCRSRPTAGGSSGPHD